MRTNWPIAQGTTIVMNDILGACNMFYATYKVVPDTLKMSYNDFHNFLLTRHCEVSILERGKEYGHFISIPGGMIELCLLDNDHETVYGNTAANLIVVESTKVDREFEEHVLNGYSE